MLNRAPKVKAVFAKDVVRQLYQTAYGIFDHIAQYKKEQANPKLKRPFAGVALHPAERPEYFRRYADLLDIFIEKKIGDKLGISFDEFLHRPSWEVKLILDRVQAAVERENKIQAGLQSQFQKELEGK